MPVVLVGIWFGTVVVTFVIVKIGRRFPTATRQEWNLGWGRAFAMSIMLFAVVLFALAAAVAWLLPHSPNEVIYGMDGAGFGLMLGAMLGCGGALGIPEDKTPDAPTNGSVSNE